MVGTRIDLQLSVRLSWIVLIEITTVDIDNGDDYAHHNNSVSPTRYNSQYLCECSLFPGQRSVRGRRSIDTIVPGDVVILATVRVSSSSFESREGN